jgi:FkbM family methyltransferase
MTTRPKPRSLSSRLARRFRAPRPRGSVSPEAAIARTAAEVPTPMRSDDDLACLIAYNKFGGYAVPYRAMHRPAAQRILAGRVHEPETIDMIISAAQHGDVVHAGTFFGDFIPALARGIVGADRIVWAFEPNPESFHCAQLTVLLNRLDNVRIEHAALSDITAARFLRIVDTSGRPLGGMSHVVEEDSPGTEQVVSVPSVAIDDAVPEDRFVAVIQLDVERHESEALSGAMATIARNLPLLVVETLPTPFFEEKLAPLGYRLIGRVNDNTILGVNGSSS